MAIFSFLSVLLGIFRDRLLATHVGIGPILDIYNAAFRMPDLLYSFSLAFVTAGTVIPYLTVEKSNGEMIDPRHKLSSLMLFFASCASLLAVVIIITIPWYANLIVPGFSAPQVDEFISVTRILMIQPLLLGITSLISCFAQMKNQFMLYGVAPLGYSLGIIFGIYNFYPVYGVEGLIYGVILGATISVMIQAISLRGTDFISILPYFSWKHIKELLQLSIPRTGVNILTQSRILFFTAFATTLGPGVLSSYLFAQRITDAFSQIIQQSVTTASLPVLSKEMVEHRIREYKDVVRRYTWLLGIIGTLAGGAIFLFQEEIIWLLYGDTGANDTISFFLDAFLVALPLQMVIGYFTISFYSAKDTKTVFVTNLISTVLAIIVCVATRGAGALSLVYAIISMAVANFLLLFVFYSRKKL